MMFRALNTYHIDDIIPYINDLRHCFIWQNLSLSDYKTGGPVSVAGINEYLATLQNIRSSSHACKISLHVND